MDNVAQGSHSELGLPVPILQLSIKDLGVTLDSHLTFVPHVNKTCRALSRSFHSIGRFRKFLSQADTERIVRAHFPFHVFFCVCIISVWGYTEILPGF